MWRARLMEPSLRRPTLEEVGIVQNRLQRRSASSVGLAGLRRLSLPSPSPDSALPPRHAATASALTDCALASVSAAIASAVAASVLAASVLAASIRGMCSCRAWWPAEGWRYASGPTDVNYNLNIQLHVTPHVIVVNPYLFHTPPRDSCMRARGKELATTSFANGNIL